MNECQKKKGQNRRRTKDPDPFLGLGQSHAAIEARKSFPDY
jgi:hypothetical protein